MAREVVIDGISNELGTVRIAEFIQICIQFRKKLFADHCCDHNLTV